MDDRSQPAVLPVNGIPDRFPTVSNLLWLPLLSPPLSADKINVEHPSDDLLERYSMRRLTEAEMAPLKEHLLICEKCRNTVVQMDLNQAAIREALKLRRNNEH